MLFCVSSVLRAERRVLDSNWNVSAPLSDMVALQEVMTKELLPPLEAITPGSGTYMNEVWTLAMLTDAI